MLGVAILVLVTTGTALARPQGDEPLPDGAGKRILLASCTACHDLKEVTKFRGFYTKPEWRDIVDTMIQYGANVEDKDVAVLVDYLAAALGKPSEPAR
jgi:hypothetical protein